MRTTVFSTPVLTPFLRLLSRVILKLIGWSTRGEPLLHQRCVLIGAPHTSNWDFPLMLMVVLKLELRVFWMGKHTLFPFPFGWLMKWLGGIPIDRSASHNMVSETVRQYEENEELVVRRTGAGFLSFTGAHKVSKDIKIWRPWPDLDLFLDFFFQLDQSCI